MTCSAAHREWKSSRQGALACALALGLAGLLSALTPGGAAAQIAEYQRSYIDPFPRGDRYRVVVLGDTFGSGLW